MQRPDLEAVKTYLEAGAGQGSATDAQVGDALAAEVQAQEHDCKIPAGDAWPADLATALCRRVAVHLQMLAKPLALQANVTAVGVGFARLGGSDPEVERLERPYRRRRKSRICG